MSEETARRGEAEPERGCRFACVNANGIAMKLEEFRAIMVDNQIDLLFISETWVGRSTTRSPMLALNERFKGHDSNPVGGPGRAHYGTAVMLHPKHDQDRSCLTRKEGGAAGFSVRTSFMGFEIGGVYLRSDWSAVECCEVIEPLIQQGRGVPSIIMGDWNLPFGGLPGEAGELGHKDRDVLAFLEDQRGHYTVLRPTSPAYTRFDQDGHGTVIDHIIGNDAARQLFIKATVLSESAAGGSDHRVVMADFRLPRGTWLSKRGKIMTTCPSAPPSDNDREYPRFRLNRLKEEGVRSNLLEMVSLKLITVQEEMAQVLENDLHTPQSNLDKFEGEITRALREAATRILGIQTVRVRRGHVISPELRAGHRNLNKALVAFKKVERERGESHPETEAAWGLFRTEKRILKKLIKIESRRPYEKFAAELAEMQGPVLLKVLSRMNKNRARGDNECALAIDPESMERHRLYTQALYRAPRASVTEETEVADQIPDLPTAREMESLREDLINRFSVERLEKIIKSRPNGSAPGRTGVNVELLKAGGRHIANALSLLFRLSYKLGLCPKTWQEMVIIPIPKKGDLTKVENYRPIVMSEVIRKVYEKCLLVTDLAGLDASLDICQGGFRVGRSAPDQVACMNEAIRVKRKSLKGDPFMAFLDIKAAYDTVSRTALWRKMEERGLPNSTICALRSLFDHNTSFLRIGKRESAGIRHQRGLIQGSILSPMLYAVFIDDLPGRLRSLGTNLMHQHRIASFFYADDIAVIADSSAHLQRMLDVCMDHSQELGYEYAPAKCKVVAPRGTEVRLNGNVLENVQTFTYLGMPIGMQGIDGALFVKETKAKTERTIGLFRSCGLNGGGFGLQVKAKLIKIFIRPQLEYGLALLGKTEARSLQSTLNYAMRAAISVPRNTSSDALRALLKIETMEAGRTRSIERFTNRAALATSEHLKNHAWNSHKRTKGGRSVFKNAERIPRVRDHRSLWENGVELIPSGGRKEQWRSLWENPIVASVQPDPRDPGRKLNLGNMVAKLRQRDQATLCRWIVRRPQGQPTPCTNCVLGRRATVGHIQRCIGVDIDDEIRKGNVTEAIPLIREAQRACFGGDGARYPTNLEYTRSLGPRTRRRDFGTPQNMR